MYGDEWLRLYIGGLSSPREQMKIAGGDQDLFIRAWGSWRCLSI